jgi:hypothetical protein
MNSEEGKMHNDEESKIDTTDNIDAEDICVKPTKDMKEHKI